MDYMNDYIDPGVSIGTEVYILSVTQKTALFTRTHCGNIGVSLDSESAIGHANKFVEDTIATLPYTPTPRAWTFNYNPGPNRITASGSWSLTISTPSSPTATDSLTLRIKPFHIRASVPAESYTALKDATLATLTRIQASELEKCAAGNMEEEWWRRFWEGGYEGGDEDSDWDVDGEGEGYWDSDDEMDWGSESEGGEGE